MGIPSLGFTCLNAVFCLLGAPQRSRPWAESLDEKKKKSENQGPASTIAASIGSLCLPSRPLATKVTLDGWPLR